MPVLPAGADTTESSDGVERRLVIEMKLPSRIQANAGATWVPALSWSTSRRTAPATQVEDLDDEVRDEPSRLVRVATGVANGPGLPDPVVGVPVHVPVQPQVRTTLLDEVGQVGCVAPGEVRVPVRQAVRMRGVVRHDDGRTVVRYGQGIRQKGPGRPVHGEDVLRLDPIP